MPTLLFPRTGAPPARRLLLQAALSATTCALAPTRLARAADVMPQLRGRRPDGQPLDLRQLRGSVVLLFAWSTSCPVCLDKWPELRANLQGWLGKPFAIVGLNLDPQLETWRAWLRAVSTLTPPTPQLQQLWRGDAEHRDDLGELSARTPTLLVLDRAGRQVQQHRGRMPPQLWDTVADLVLS